MGKPSQRTILITDHHVFTVPKTSFKEMGKRFATNNFNYGTPR
jgi:hypothetical protein